MTIQDVALNLQLHWNTVKEIEKRYLEKHYSRPRLKDVRYIAIDEFAVQKGHRYMTVVYDLEARRAIYVGDNREGETLKTFWKRLKSSGAKVQAVAVDMWPAYIASIQEHLPQASIIFDRFHLMKKMNEALDTTRRMLYREETTVNNKKIIKGLRWLLLKNDDHLNTQKNEKQRLEEALQLNQPLAQSYYLKEELRLLWQQPSKYDAEIFLTEWVKKAHATTIQPLQKFCGMLLSHRTGILNWYDQCISTGPLEGFNNKIKVMKRKAYGYRDLEFFKLKIYALHKTRYVLL